jgi:hypothetical protein
MLQDTTGNTETSVGQRSTEVSFFVGFGLTSIGLCPTDFFMKVSKIPSGPTEVRLKPSNFHLPKKKADKNYLIFSGSFFADGS